MVFGRHVARYHRAGADDGALADTDPSENDGTAADPGIVTDLDRPGDLQAGLPPGSLPVMLGTIDLHIGAEQRSLADADRRGVQDGAAGIEEGAVAEKDIEAVGAMKRRFDPGALAHAAEQHLQRRAKVAALPRWQRIVLEHRIRGGGAQRLQLRIEACIPLARGHLCAFASGHDGCLRLTSLPQHNCSERESVRVPATSSAKILSDFLESCAGQMPSLC